MKILTKSSIARTIALSLTLSLVAPLSALAASPAAVNLGSAGDFAILAKTGVSTTGTTAVVGDIGVSPAQATYITGFSLILPTTSAFSTSALVTGKIYAPGYANPTAANLTTAVLDMQSAYTDAAGRAPTVTELGSGNIGGLTLVPGVYKWSTGVTIPTNVTLSGSANDVWIFQVAQNLSVSSGAHVVLSGGAQASNIFWQVAGQTTIGTTAVMNGNILDQTAIVLNTGATLNGRALAQSAVTLDASAVTKPTSDASTAVIPEATVTPATPVATATPVVPTVTSSVTTTSAASVTTTPSTSATLSTEQQKSYDDLTSAGASHSMALEAVSHISAEAVVTHSSSGQQVREIATDLGEGSKDATVTTLQQFLISQDKGSSAQALAKVGATSYFGTLTREALAEFQASVGISPALGNFGPITRGYVSAHY